MRITTPHMGNVDLLLEDLFGRLGVEYLPPPKTTQATMKLGLQHAPEFACLPLKVTVGNLIEGLDAGADATLMVGGCGPCRFGYYADIQRRIIEGLGYDYTPFTIEPPTYDFKQFVGTIRHISGDLPYSKIWQAFKVSFRKAQAVDRVEKRTLQVRCYEPERGLASRVREQAAATICAARTRDEIVAAEARALALFDEMPKADREVLKVGLVGEFYLLLEPFVNFDIEEWLGERGVYVERSVYLTDWIGPSSKNPVGGHSDAFVAERAAPFLDYRVGGEGQATIGHTLIYKNEGFDGVVQLLPFTCMPDTIAKSILPALCKSIDMPALTLIVDEQTGKAGVHTRLEAFLDLLASRRRAEARARASSSAEELVTTG